MKIKTNHILVLFVLMFFCISVFANAHLPIRKAQPLSKARKALITKSWKPYPVYDMVKNPKEVSMMAREYIKAGYIEVGNCGVSNPDCSFNYRKGKKCLQVIAGSYEAPVDETTVTEWTNECEEP